MDFNLVVDADAILEPSVGFGNDRCESPPASSFDLLDEIDAVRVIRSVEKRAERLESGHPKSPPLRPTLSKRGHHRGHQGGMFLIPKVAG
jgi:hypothetical protein